MKKFFKKVKKFLNDPLPGSCKACGCPDSLSRILYYDDCPECKRYCDERYSSSRTKIDYDGFAHEIWATAQLFPNEGITDGVDRIKDILKKFAKEIKKCK